MNLVFGFKSIVKRNFRDLSATVTPMHVRSLRIIDREPSCTSQHIAGFLQRDKAQIARLVKELIGQDLVESQSNPRDKRSRLLGLTVAGKSVLQRLQSAEVDAVNRMTRGFSKKELKLFVELAEKMAGNLAADNSA